MRSDHQQEADDKMEEVLTRILKTATIKPHQTPQMELDERDRRASSPAKTCDPARPIACLSATIVEVQDRAYLQDETPSEPSPTPFAKHEFTGITNVHDTHVLDLEVYHDPRSDIGEGTEDDCSDHTTSDTESQVNGRER
jgi:hypothetical protein